MTAFGVCGSIRAHMKRLVLLVSVITLFVAAVLLFLAMQRNPPVAADVLPAGTLLFVDFPNFRESRQDWQQTAAYRLFNEPEVHELLRPAIEGIQELLGVKSDTETFHQILEAMEGEIFVAVTRVIILPKLQLGIVVGADVSHRRLESAAAMLKLEHGVRKYNPKVKVRTARHAGTKYTVYEVNKDMTICQATLSSLLVFTVGEATMRDVISQFKNPDSKTSPSLSRSTRYQQVKSQMPLGQELMTYINTEQLMALLGPALIMSGGGSSIASTFAANSATGYGLTFTNNGVLETTFTLSRSENLNIRPPTSRKSLSLTTPQTLLYSAQNTDVPALYESLMQFVSQNGTPETAKAATQFELHLRRNGVRIREDVLQKFGPETAFIGNWPKGASLPSLTMAAECRSDEAFAAALDKTMTELRALLLAGAPEGAPEWETIETSGQVIRALRLGSRFAPAYTVANGFFLLSTHPDSLAGLLEQTRPDGHPTLIATEAYRTAFRHLKMNGQSLLYANLPELAEPVTSYVRALLQSSANTAPLAGKLKSHLFPHASVSLVDEQTTTTQTFSPLGKVPLMAAAGAVVWMVYSEPITDWFMQFIPDASTSSSGTDAFPAPRGNQREASQTSVHK